MIAEMMLTPKLQTQYLIEKIQHHAKCGKMKRFIVTLPYTIIALKPLVSVVSQSLPRNIIALPSNYYAYCKISDFYL